MKKRVIVFAAGYGIDNGQGFQEIVEDSRTKPPILEANIVAVVSDHVEGGVRQKANRLGIPFVYFPGPFSAEEYQKIIKRWSADFVVCCGWLKPILGLMNSRVINSHLGPLPRFRGKSLYGRRLQEAVLAAYQKGEITQSAVSFHFVSNEKYNRGAGIVQIPVPIRPGDDVKSLTERAQEIKRSYQSLVLNGIFNGRIKLASLDNDVYFADKDLFRFAFRNE